MTWNELKTEAEIDFFEGALNKGKKEGFCRLVYNTGMNIEGFFKNNEIKNGLITFNNGFEFQGEF